MTKMKELGGIAKRGVLTSNPTFRLVLGTCPTLAVTTGMISGLAMGLATTFVLLFSNIIISALRKVIPDKVRIPAYIVVIATFVTLIEMLMRKFLPDLYETLGVFISLIVVNCIIFARAESFASKNPVLDSAADGLFMGLGFTLSLSLIGACRELLASGSIAGWTILPASVPRIGLFVLPAGGFLMFGLLMAFFQWLPVRLAARKAKKSGEGK